MQLTMKKSLRWRLSSITRKIITLNVSSQLDSSLIIEIGHANRTKLLNISSKNKSKKLKIFLLKWRKTKLIKKRLRYLTYNWNVLKIAPNNTRNRLNRFCFKRKKSSNNKETISRRNKKRSIVLKKNMKRMSVL